MRRRDPRPASHAVAALAQRLAPQTLLAEIQTVWADAVGEVVAAQAEPTGEREGTVVVTCSSAVWAQELDLMAPDLVARLNDALASPRVRALRCGTTPARAWSRASAER